MLFRSLLGAASLTGLAPLRAACDLAGAGVLIAYLRSPAVLLRRAAARGQGAGQDRPGHPAPAHAAGCAQRA